MEMSDIYKQISIELVKAADMTGMPFKFEGSTEGGCSLTVDGTSMSFASPEEALQALENITRTPEEAAAELVLAEIEALKTRIAEDTARLEELSSQVN